ncbi:MAG: NUDIX domain-containing protein [Rhodospirillales bacterium]|nr:NUDIX domain-containing protein [Rhodospirillales bacterium]MDH3917155.1 NUDIX domain-containing protein [Rhodospirillales bacterium]MDH3968319.1 NUDIX domain-containing protein [Rhodospirillales bacterium]
MAPNSSSDDRVEIIDKQTPFRGYFQIDAYRLRHRTFDGGWTREMSREVFERGHAAAVLLYDPDRDAVVLVEQFRTGAHAAGLEPWLIETVAGIIEPGEEAAEVVRREALEEAGCNVGDLEPIGTFILSPGGSSETMMLFCGRVDSAGAGGVHGLDHEDEDIRALVLPTDEALELLRVGRIVNATTALALQWLALNRERQRAAWR